jgi:hypothetical protein
MASFVFESFRNRALGLTTTIATAIDCDTDTLAGFFVDDSDVGGTWPISTGTTYAFQASLEAGEDPVFPGDALASPAISGGAVDATDPVFDGGQLLLSAQALDSFVVMKTTGTDTTSPNLCRFDSTGATGLPLTPNGAAVTVVFNSSGIFRF